MSITTALEARRDAMRDREAGFTLIELLVVVIIIGILAAIAIPVYIGIQNSSKDSAVKSDLSNDKTSLVGYYTANSTSSALSSSNFNATTLGTYGFVTPTASNYDSAAPAPVYASGSTTSSFCLSAKSASGNVWYITTNGAIAGGTSSSTCPASTSW